MAKKDNTIWISVGIVLVIIIILSQGNTGILNPNPGTNGTDENNPGGGGSGGGGGSNPIKSPCQTYAESSGYSYYKSPITSRLSCDTFAFSSCSNAGLAFDSMSWSSNLQCCAYDCKEKTAGSCVDSDGDNRDTVGNVQYNGQTYTDKCLEVGQAVTEYICQNGQVASKNWMCDYGEICMQTRSGGHCIPAPTTWSPGDTVFQGSGGGSITGGTVPIGASMDLADYGITTDGDCQLGAQISTSWSYANSQCTGINGMEGIKWDFYDSAGLEYSRVDTTPVSLGVDLHPTSHYLEWDGQTDWRGTISKTLNLPNCNIDYEYTIRIYIYSCS